MKYIYQRDFNEGTYRIRESGYYRLMENIVFHPNPDHNFLPRKDQSQYPLSQGYVLGFFAALTIENNNIELDLNGYKIEFSNEFNLKQRFGAVIELGSSPFIPKQGPANFGDEFKGCNNVVIKNGYLGRNPHHGIHGNNCFNVIIKNLVIENFEIAGISLNGAMGVQIEEVVIQNTSSVQIMSSYSQAKFCLPVLEKMVENNPGKNLITHDKIYTGPEILTSLKNEIINLENHVLHNTYYNGIFLNKTGLTDGNIYGISLNSEGVLINEFKTKWEESSRNKDHIVKNVIIRNMKSLPKESRVLAVENETDPNYGKKVCKGIFGDVLDFNFCVDENGYYKGNVLSNAQLFLNLYSSEERKGTANLPPSLYNWVESRENINDVVQSMKDEIYWVEGIDSMAHSMKGNIGLFVSQGENVHITGLEINNIANYGEEKNVLSSQCTGIVVSGSRIVAENGVRINNIYSPNGKSYEQLFI